MRGRLDIVGVGDGGLDGLTRAALDAIEQADVLVGGKRHLGFVPERRAPGQRHGQEQERWSWPSPFDPLYHPVKAAVSSGRRVVVLASGDPRWYGVAKQYSTITPQMTHPHPSAFQLAAARLGWSLDSTSIDLVSLHGRSIDNARLPIQLGNWFIALGDGQTANGLARMLVEMGCGHSTIKTFSHLGGPEERIERGSALGWIECDLPALTTIAVAVDNPNPLPLGPGLPDDLFVHDGQLTKREVRAVTVGRLSGGSALWDVGAGCGSVAIEWLRLTQNYAVAFEQHAGRAAMIKQNARSLGVPGVVVETGPFTAITQSAPPDRIFIGGGLTAEVLEHCWDKLLTPGTLVANAVTTKAERLLTEFAEALGQSDALCRIAVERAKPIGSYVGWQPFMTVTQLAVQKR